MANPNSLTGQYLSGKKKIPVPAQRRQGNGKFLKVIGAAENNLRHIDVTFPLGTFTVVTGVSGSGKSSLVNEVLSCERWGRQWGLGMAWIGTGIEPGPPGPQGLRSAARTWIRKGGQLGKVNPGQKWVNIDQSPHRPDTPVQPRHLYGAVQRYPGLVRFHPGGQEPGLWTRPVQLQRPGRPVRGCSGDGVLKIEMHFLPDIFVPCEVCKGKRYNRETLEVHYKGKNIADVLDMTVDEGVEFFSALPKLRNKLQTLQDVGLGYVKLGQPSTELSGGEAQRVKLATELSKIATGKTIYILDEPTTGLHTDDVRKLLEVLQRLVDNGNTVVVIEHNLDVIKCADHLIDLGPEGGDGGGTIVCTGTPEEVAACPESYTGQYLKRMLK